MLALGCQERHKCTSQEKKKQCSIHVDQIAQSAENYMFQDSCLQIAYNGSAAAMPFLYECAESPPAAGPPIDETSDSSIATGSRHGIPQI